MADMNVNPRLANKNVQGALWMVLSMAAFAVEDSLIKWLSHTMPLSQIMVYFGFAGAVVFALIAKLRNQSLFIPDVVSKPMLWRLVFELTGRLFFFLAIVLIPLSAATVILQATPLVVTAIAAVLFAEKVGLRRWLAIILGLVGVVIVVRPGADDFSALSMLAVVGMLGFAGRDLASRAAPASVNTTLLGLYGFLTVLVAGAAFAVWERQVFVAMEASHCVYLLALVLVGVGAYSCLMKAMRTGEVAAVTPFRYSRLLFGVGLGVWVFGEPLSQHMVLGAILIAAAGLLLMSKSKSRSITGA